MHARAWLGLLLLMGGSGLPRYLFILSEAHAEAGFGRHITTLANCPADLFAIWLVSHVKARRFPSVPSATSFPSSFLLFYHKEDKRHPKFYTIHIDLPLKPPEVIMLVQGTVLVSLALQATAAAYRPQSRLRTSNDCPSGDGVHIVRSPKHIPSNTSPFYEVFFALNVSRTPAAPETCVPFSVSESVYEVQL